MIVYSDGLLEVTETNHPGWVAIDWLYPGKEPFKTGRVFFRVDRLIMDKGYQGWLMWSEKDHSNMHKHIMRAGGFPYAMDQDKIYFKKQFPRGN